ncbi:MAG TPA: hypothetical protein PLA68_00300 [Panacibacter sp.]|nr:hypothetical protein [Panacibacter sp.]
MKSKLFLFSILFFTFCSIKAQKPPAKNTIPPFNILLTNLTYLKAEELTKDANKMIVYFDPTCEHCKLFTADILKHSNDFGNTQIIMISYTPIAQIAQFETDFNLTKYPNIKAGTEGYTFLVQRFYNVQKFPFTALYNRQGLLVAFYRQAPAVSELLLKMKKT